MAWKEIDQKTSVLVWWTWELYNESYRAKEFWFNLWTFYSSGTKIDLTETYLLMLFLIENVFFVTKIS